MTDVVVIGGGPAGLVTAIHLRLAGLGATVVDRSSPPIDKACGEGLMPDALARLLDLGVALERSHPFRGIRYLDGNLVAEGRFPGDAGAGVRRLDLHRALVRRAEELGVDLRWRTRVLGLLPDGAESTLVQTDAGPLRGRYVVGADGLHSKVRRWIGVVGRPEPRRRWRFGVRHHVRTEPWSDLVEVYWADGCEAYVTPVAEDEVGVAILWSGRKACFDDLLTAFPRLEKRLAGTPTVSRDRGAGPLRQRVRGVVRGRVALVGDASGYIDAITGEGLALALAQAAALADALRRDDLATYARVHPRLGRFPNELTKLLLQVERRPWLRRRVVRALARDGALFDRLLAVLTGEAPESTGLKSAPRLLWRLVGP